MKHEKGYDTISNDFHKMMGGSVFLDKSPVLFIVSVGKKIIMDFIERKEG